MCSPAKKNEVLLHGPNQSEATCLWEAEDYSVVVAARAHDFFVGTFLPFLRALDKPMAIACLRLLTLPPLPPLPLLAVPRLYRCISRLTSLPAPREYFRLLLAIGFFLECPTRTEDRATYSEKRRLPF